MLQKPIAASPELERLLAGNHDRLFSFIMADDTVRGALVAGSRLVNQMRANHELGILETLTLGQGYLAAALLAATLKGRDRLSLQIDCSGPIKGLCVEANADKEVRGYLKQVPIQVDRPLESFDLSPFFGAGFLTVSRYLEGTRQPFSGNIMLQYGSLAKDLANYFLTSEQLPTALNLSVQFNQDGEVVGASGLLLQAMPGASDETVAQLEKVVAALPSLGLYFAKQGEADPFINEQFKTFAPRMLADFPVAFRCHCQPDSIRKLLGSLPADEQRDIHANGPFPLEVRCHHCNTLYAFSRAELADLPAVRSAG